jgi:hypothetical protein
MGKKKKKFSGCRDCGHLAKHPFCTLCQKKCHWVGGLVTNEQNREDIDRGAPARRIEHRVSIAYMLPFMVEQGILPKEDLQRVTRQVLGNLVERVVDTQVYGFEWGKHPYRWKVVEADLTGDGMPFVKIRYGGWSCRDHRGANPADLPAMVLERDRYTCVVCGATKNLVVTYLVPPEEKGRASLGNMTTFCRGCTLERGERSYWAFLKQKGIPLGRLVIDFSTGYVRSIVSGDRVTL